MNRPSIPAGLRRLVEVESGHNCAITTCRKSPIDVHHIIPYEKCNEHAFENLIALCPNCHARYHRTKEIDQKSMQIYKMNLGLVNSRYGDFGRTLLDFFCLKNRETTWLSLGFEVAVYHLLKDGVLKKTGNNSAIATDGLYTSEEYQLTDLGKELLDNWKKALLLQ